MTSFGLRGLDQRDDVTVKTFGDLSQVSNRRFVTGCPAMNLRHRETKVPRKLRVRAESRFLGKQARLQWSQLRNTLRCHGSAFA